MEWFQGTLKHGGASTVGRTPATRMPPHVTPRVMAHAEPRPPLLQPAGRGLPTEEEPADVVVTGRWTCCRRVEPGAPGCVVTTHASDSLQCGSCGLWVPLSTGAWTKDRGCQRHAAPAELLRWGTCRWPCCNDRGFRGTRMADLDAEAWLRARQDGRPPRKLDGRAEVGGCQLGRHTLVSGVPGRDTPTPTCPWCQSALKPGAKRCGGCGEAASWCTQCHTLLEAEEGDEGK